MNDIQKSISAASPEHSATVSASAGTGKTWLLVTRLLRLLLAGARADAILAVTFTRKAAAEMQTRLNSRLFELASCDTGKLEEKLAEIGVRCNAFHRDRARRLYEELLNSPHTIRTSTFHSFCQDILRRFPLEAGIAPGFELLESESELRTAALEALISEASEAPDNPTAQALEQLLESCGGLANMLGALQAFLSHRSDWWAFTQGQTNPLQFATDTLTTQLAVQPDSDPLQGFFTAARLDELHEYARLLGMHKAHHGAADQLAMALMQDNPEQRMAQIRQVLLTQAGTPRARKESAAQEKSMGAAGQARFLELHSHLCEALQELADIQNAHQTLARNRAWYQAGTRLLEHYQRIKGEQRLLDFTDLEWKAYQLLTQGDNAHWVQYKLDQRIDHLLVDEFQDTNPTQWRLLLPLLEELAAGNGERERSVFLVGDGKQSIYRFRRADPELFDAAQDWLRQHLDAISQPLNVSWRSAPVIMEFINRVFGSGPLHARLSHFSPHATHHQRLWGRVELLPLIETPEEEIEAPSPFPRNPLLTPRHIPQDQRHRLEAQQIAQRIQALIAQQMVIGEGDAARPLRHDDIMILLRHRTHASAFEEALREAGIPYAGADRGTLLESQEAQDMLSLLELLAAPYDNLALASLLRSPLFACDHASLISLAMAGHGSWIDRLERLVKENPGHECLHRAHTLLSQWRQAAGVSPVHDLLDRIFCEGDVMNRYHAAYPEHLQHRVSANLTRFLELALEIDSGRYPSIGHFIARLRSLRQRAKDAPDEGLPIHTEARVRIMTIHGSKGLEAPVVFLADATNSASHATAHQALVEWPADQQQPSSFLLLGTKNQHDAYSRKLLERHQHAEQREDANLLYVALTRARQLLFISGCRPKRGSELGWYGLIETQCKDAADATSTGLAFETGSMPRVSPQAPPAPMAINVDPQLSEPLAVFDNFQADIAPSQTAAGGTSSGLDDDMAQTRGIAIHRMLQLLTEKADDIPRRVAAELGIAADTPALRDWFQEAETVIHDQQFAALFEMDTDTLAHNEIPLQYREGANWVYGIVDRLVLRGDDIWLVDYKTHPVSRQAVADIALGYREQMALYRKGIAKLWPDKRIHCGLLFTAIPLWHAMEV